MLADRDIKDHHRSGHPSSMIWQCIIICPTNCCLVLTEMMNPVTLPFLHSCLTFSLEFTSIVKQIKSNWCRKVNPSHRQVSLSIYGLGANYGHVTVPQKTNGIRVPVTIWTHLGQSYVKWPCEKTFNTYYLSSTQKQCMSSQTIFSFVLNTHKKTTTES